MTRLYLQTLVSLFVTSYDLQVEVIELASALAELLVLVIHPRTDPTENICIIIACLLVAGESKCPQRCSLEMAVILSTIYRAAVVDRMNRFIGSLAIITTLSYHYFEIAITITHKQL
jgi:hypothetical protein